jgi:hypothetical protein
VGTSEALDVHDLHPGASGPRHRRVRIAMITQHESCCPAGRCSRRPVLEPCSLRARCPARPA